MDILFSGTLCASIFLFSTCFPLDKERYLMYNNFTLSILAFPLSQPLNGGVKVSTGTLKYDKRAELRCNLLKLRHV